MAGNKAIEPYVNADTLLIVSPPSPGSRPVAPMMQFFSCNALRNTSRARTVKLFTKDAEGNYMSVGHDDISIKIMQASSSLINEAVKRERRPIQTIELPPNDVLAYERIFDSIQQSFDEGTFTNVLTVTMNDKNKPIAEYYAMNKIASELGMIRYKKDLEYRIFLLLFPDLTKKWFAVRPADIAAVLKNKEVKKGFEFFESIANAIGRAWVAKAIAKSQLPGIQNLLNMDFELKEAFEVYRKKWSAKKAAGDNILIV